MDNILENQLWNKIKILDELIWEGRASAQNISLWLSNFSGKVCNQEIEKIHALYLLSHFIFLGDHQIKEALKAMYRDLIQYPMFANIRQQNSDTLDFHLVMKKYNALLSKTRFLGVGNPSESGFHLLYYFRQENKLKKASFINAYEVFKYDRQNKRIVADESIERYIFIDDFWGSGEQSVKYIGQFVTDLKKISPGKEIAYYAIAGTNRGKAYIKDNIPAIDNIACVFEFDQSDMVFSNDSKILKEPPCEITREQLKLICQYYGRKIYKRHPLGYADAQMLLGFQHNTPNSTLPVIWGDAAKWNPIFERHGKQ